MQHPRYIVMRNRNAKGQAIRPSNWAERLAGNAAQFHNGRLIYDGRVIPCTACADHVCLRIDRAVAVDKPHVLENIETFMRVNAIPDYANSCPQVCDISEKPVAA